LEEVVVGVDELLLVVDVFVFVGVPILILSLLILVLRDVLLSRFRARGTGEAMEIGDERDGPDEEDVEDIDDGVRTKSEKFG
jgi:hypothetical protein